MKRLTVRLAIGNLAPLGLMKSDVGPLPTIKERRKIPMIDVGTWRAFAAATSRCEKASSPLTARSPFRGRNARAFDAVVLATGFTLGCMRCCRIISLLDEHGSPRA